jgi:PAS domain S-box-containing protein
MMSDSNPHGGRLNAAVVLADRNGVIRFWSEGAEAAFGFKASDAVGQRLDLIVPAEYRQDHWKGFNRAVEMGAAPLEGKTTPFPVRTARGDVAPTPGRLTLVRCPRGAVVAVVVAFEPALAD